MDAPTRADVDAARGLVEEDDSWPAEHPFREEHLLLVAAGIEGDTPVDRRRRHIEMLDQAADAPALGRFVDDAEAAHCREVRQRNIGPDDLGKDETLLPAILGDEGKAAPDRVGRAWRAIRLA